ncbi:hypothetical protein [Chryseobacterium contaminans]
MSYFYFPQNTQISEMFAENRILKAVMVKKDKEIPKVFINLCLYFISDEA